MFIQIPSHVIMEMRRPKTTDGSVAGGRYVDNFVLTGNVDVSKLENLVSFRLISTTPYTLGTQKKIKERGIFFRTWWDIVFVPLLLRDLVELRGRIRNEFAAVTKVMLMRVWTEMEYGLDICLVTKAADIESLYH
ncbi:uncharacterized protein TNCV_3148481 [Trichonephila clavipes]|nr:uncharacterized protein TNCV_3148481 [Trichonephila clavipes]